MATIEVKDKYYFQINLTTNDIEGIYDIQSFIITQKAGGGLPLFEISMSTKNDLFIRSLNEQKEITVSFGRTSRDTLIKSSLRIQKFDFAKEGTDYYTVNIKGIIGNPKYISDCKIQGFKNKTSIEVMKEIANSYLAGVHCNSVNTNDKQIWIRNNTSPLKFINELHKHSYINDNNFLMLGVSIDEKLIITDLETTIKKALIKPKIKLIYGQPQQSDEKVYNTNYVLENNSGFLNNLGIYTKKRILENVIDNKNGIIISTPAKKAKLAMTDKLNIIKNEPNIFNMPMYQDKNTHSNYWKAYYNNTSKLLLTSSTNIEVEISGEYVDLDLFDVVYFDDFPLAGEQKTTEHVSGFYIVSEISYSYYKSTFFINLVLNRESNNKLIG